MTDQRALQCTEVTTLPLADVLMALWGATDDGTELWRDLIVPCELGSHDHSEHAASVGERGDADETLWLLWTYAGYEVAWLAPCEAMYGDNEACWFPLAHSGGHAWEVSDPTLDAYRAELIRDRYGESPP